MNVNIDAQGMPISARSGDFLSSRVLDLDAYNFEYEELDSIGKLYLKNIEAAEEIVITGSSLVNYLVLESLPNLRRVRIESDNSYCLQWICIAGSPRLTELEICGSVTWIDLYDLSELTNIDLRQCHSIAHLSLEGLQNLRSLKIDGCIKLPEVCGLPKEQLEKLCVEEQISENQNNRIDARQLKANMTFNEIDSLINKINQRCEDLYLKGMTKYWNRLDVELLEPLQATFTGGTGETYVYEQQCCWIDKEDNNSVFCWMVMGYQKPEDCIEDFLEMVEEDGIESDYWIHEGFVDEAYAAIRKEEFERFKKSLIRN